MSDLTGVLRKAYSHYIRVLIMQALKHDLDGESTIVIHPGLDGEPDHLVVTIPGDLQFQISVIPIPKEDPPTGNKPVRRPT